MLVPYRAPPQAQRRGGFADYLRRGGRVNPIALGAAPRDEESLPLMGDDSDVAKILRRSERTAQMTQFAILVALVFATLVFAGLGVVVMRANDSIDQLQAVVEPHAQTVVNATVDMLHDMGGSMYNIKQITHMTNELAQANLGPQGNAGQAINNTVTITKLLANFMTHPVMHIALGDGPTGAGGR